MGLLRGWCCCPLHRAAEGWFHGWVTTAESDRTLGDLERVPGTVAWTTTRALGISPNGVPWLRAGEPAALKPTRPMRVRWDVDGWQVWPVVGVDQPPCRKEPGWLRVAVLHEPVESDDPTVALTDEDRAWLHAHGWVEQA